VVCLTLVLAAVTVALASAAPAPAGTAKTEAAISHEVDSEWVVYAAYPGEWNRVKITVAHAGFAPSIYTLTDAAGIVAHGGCMERDANTAVCVVPNEYSGPQVALGGKNDRLTLAADVYDAEVSDGPGDDLVEGGGHDDYLSNDGGNDVLRGRRGDDELLSGPGNDQLSGGPGNDKISGGPGGDEFSGGRGDDSINSADGVVERVNCGGGRRDRIRADRRDRLRGCERVRRVRPRASHRAKVARLR
jgi:hypothetical protein